MNDDGLSKFTTEVVERLNGQDLSKPVGMLNLLKFREQADYPEGSCDAPCSGREAYGRYAAGTAPILQTLGGTILLNGHTWLIGTDHEWDMSFVVHYRQLADFLSLRTNPDYLKALHHRAAALLDSRLLMMEFGKMPPFGAAGELSAIARS